MSLCDFDRRPTMKGTFAVTGFVVGLLAFGGSDLSACGDKSLSAGGIRMQRALAARYPASILIYAPSASRLQGATHQLRLQETLLKVGHKYREVSTVSDLRASVDTGQFNVVLADLDDVAALQQQLASSPSRVAVIAVVSNLTKAETAEAAKQNRFLIKAPSHAAKYLTTIADAVRSKGPHSA
jgi:delta 1-pyrroline-5-carboxylate dehydrogenase